MMSDDRLRARVTVMTKQILEGETPAVKNVIRIGAAKSGESRASVPLCH
jgi:hypothetical protein